MNKINIYSFADEANEKIEGQIEAMQRNALTGIEIRNINGRNVVELENKEAMEVKKQLDAAGLKVISIGSAIGKIDIEKDDFVKHIEKFKYSIEKANIFETDKIRMFSFFIPEDKPSEFFRNEVIERLGTLIDIAKKSGISLCHENEKGIYGDTAERCLELHNAFPELNGVFDPANFVQCGQDTKVAWELLKNYITYMHIKDALFDGNVVPAGKGAGNVEYVVKRFIERGGRDFTIEPHLSIFNGIENLERDGDASEVGKKYVYASNDEAFDAAVAAFREII